MHHTVYDLVGLAVLVYFIIRQVTPRRPSRLRFYILPIAALVFAYHDLPHPVPAGQISDAAISVGISAAFGVMQAYFTRVYQSGSQWVMRGDWRYVVSWLVLFGIRILMTLKTGAHGPQASVTWIVALEIAAIWGVRSVVLQHRYPELRQVLTPQQSR